MTATPASTPLRKSSKSTRPDSVPKSIPIA